MGSVAIQDGDAGEKRPSHCVVHLIAVLVLAASLMDAADAAGGECKSTRLQVLGSGGPELDDGRRSSAYLLSQGISTRLLLDAGSGSSVAFGAAGARFADLDAILLTHLHTDHSADLPSFIKGSFFTDRSNDLVIAGPAGNEWMPDTGTFISKLIGPNGAFRYLSSYLEPGSENYTLKPKVMPTRTTGQLSGGGWRASSLPVRHGPIPAVAWRIELSDCVIVYAGDMSTAPGDFSAFAKGADLLILHAAIPEFAGPAARRLHMTPGELVALANEVRPGRVLVSHIMKRSERAVLESFDALTASLVVARDGLTLQLE